MSDLRGKTLFITGATRGIGHAIGLRAAQDGANIVIAAKTVKPHSKLPGTIQSAAADMEAAGGSALAVRTSGMKSKLRPRLRKLSRPSGDRYLCEQCQRD